MCYVSVRGLEFALDRLRRADWEREEIAKWVEKVDGVGFNVSPFIHRYLRGLLS